MSPEAQRIAIAGACGWREINRNSFPGGGWSARTPGDMGWGMVSDYLSDLNAMHEAESSMDMPFNSEYSHFLANVCVRCRGISEDNLEVGDGYEIALTATAAQRAEAFLKTIGKWDDK